MQVGQSVRFRLLPSGGVEYDPDGDLVYTVTETIERGDMLCARCVSDEGISPVWLMVGV